MLLSGDRVLLLTLMVTVVEQPPLGFPSWARLAYCLGKCLFSTFGWEHEDFAFSPATCRTEGQTEGSNIKPDVWQEEDVSHCSGSLCSAEVCKPKGKALWAQEGEAGGDDEWLERKLLWNSTVAQSIQLGKCCADTLQSMMLEHCTWAFVFLLWS